MSKKSSTRAAYIHPEVQFALDELGDRLRRARALRGQTLEEMAARIGVQPATLSRLERGAPGTSIETLAAALWAMNLLGNLDLVASPANDEEGQRLAMVSTPKRVRHRTSMKGWDVLKKL
jgi:transcriptional regulator with XRE-family HTH domain